MNQAVAQAAVKPEKIMTGTGEEAIITDSEAKRLFTMLSVPDAAPKRRYLFSLNRIGRYYAGIASDPKIITADS